MNVPTLGQYDAVANQVPSPPHTCHVGVALRGLATDVVRRLEQIPLVLPGDGGEAYLEVTTYSQFSSDH
jgi:hypothetical protein